ncbi:MAG: gmhA [Chlamydiales bacterium]|jgi:D-sedoheptulose 7-phosphate isomerase|nr:gmhA [Chlamydiales bacterium]
MISIFNLYFIQEIHVQPYIVSSIQDSIRAKEQLLKASSLVFMEEAAAMIANCFRTGHKIIIAGNGGSLCDANHFAEEFTGQFRKRRPALPAISLSEGGHITCVANDFGYEEVFARGVEAYGKPGDIFIGITTSGNSANIIKAFEQAKVMKLHTVAFLGKGGGKLKGKCDLEIIIDGFVTSDRIQEAHMTAIHTIIEIVEYHLYGREQV